jgi:hypothetical protein
MQYREPGCSERSNRYDLLLSMIDDDDIRLVFGRYPNLEKRVRKNHQKFFRELLREYEREAWVLNQTRIRTLMADGRWGQSWRGLLRASDYGRLCLGLRWAATLRRWRIGNPVSVVQGCLAELRRLDDLEASSRSLIIAFPSA